MFEDTKKSAKEIFETVEKYRVIPTKRLCKVIHRFQDEYKYRNNDTRKERLKLKEELKELETS